MNEYPYLVQIAQLRRGSFVVWVNEFAEDWIDRYDAVDAKELMETLAKIYGGSLLSRRRDETTGLATTTKE